MWYNEVKEFMLSCGFGNSWADTFFFVCNALGNTTYFFMYVDDLLLQEIMMTSFSRFYIFFL